MSDVILRVCATVFLGFLSVAAFMPFAVGLGMSRGDGWLLLIPAGFLLGVGLALWLWW